jgi:hypothetical protein
VTAVEIADGAEGVDDLDGVVAAAAVAATGIAIGDHTDRAAGAICLPRNTLLRRAIAKIAAVSTIGALRTIVDPALR